MFLVYEAFRNAYDPVKNPDGVLMMGIAENELMYFIPFFSIARFVVGFKTFASVSLPIRPWIYQSTYADQLGFPGEMRSQTSLTRPSR